jgi:hypothetical protein
MSLVLHVTDPAGERCIQMRDSAALDDDTVAYLRSILDNPQAVWAE